MIHKTRFISVVMFLALTIGITFPISFVEAEELPIPGGDCNEPEAIYNYTSEIAKTPWMLNELYAVPVGTVSPETWDQSSYFGTQFLAELQSGESAEDFAQACDAVWQNFFTDDADVIVTLRRTINTTNQVLQCISGNWTSISTENLQFNDVSDWLSTSSDPYDVTVTSSEILLQGHLESLLENLNNQPGADSP